ncbi:hypothetical protein H1C71_033056, partial [Ictidomys tridecemlineatus]
GSWPGAHSPEEVSWNVEFSRSTATSHRSLWSCDSSRTFAHWQMRSGASGKDVTSGLFTPQVPRTPAVYQPRAPWRGEEPGHRARSWRGRRAPEDTGADAVSSLPAQLQQVAGEESSTPCRVKATSALNSSEFKSLHTQRRTCLVLPPP